MRKAEFLRILQYAQIVANEHISAVRGDGSQFARGLANEGYQGGYATALRDVHAMLTHGYPGDDRRVWAEASMRMRKKSLTATPTTQKPALPAGEG